jgi:predicted XRE-type DNA-binding protein
MRHKEIRNAMKQKGIAQWKLGELLGISENTVNRKLRKELSEEEKQKILAVIDSFEK